MRALLAWTLAALVWTSRGAPRSAYATATTPTLSIGYPNGGKLVGGRMFRETRYMKALPARASSSAKWAIPELLDLLDHASRSVAKSYRGAVLHVGELSNHDGGPIASHRSHQSGRDADIAFYFVDDRGRSVRPSRYVKCDRHGGARSEEPLRFDVKKNWTLVRAMLEDKTANVMQIFIYAPLRAKLLAYAERTGTPESVLARARASMAQPMNAEPHDDHFHVRIACPPALVPLGCIDYAKAREPEHYWLLGGELFRAPSAASLSAAGPNQQDPPSTGLRPAADLDRAGLVSAKLGADVLRQAGAAHGVLETRGAQPAPPTLNVTQPPLGHDDAPRRLDGRGDDDEGSPLGD